MANYRSPGVYVEEIALLPPSIAEVESAVPAFVGYTEKAMLNTADDLRYVPTRITSFRDYVEYFGGAHKEVSGAFDIKVIESKNGAVTTGFKVTITKALPDLTSKHNLYFAIKHFYANGGGSCYITSVGDYAAAVDLANLTKGLDAVGNEDAPTLLSVPEAIYLNTIADYTDIIQQMQTQASTLKDRFALLDTYKTTSPKNTSSVEIDAKTATENVLGDGNIRRYGAVYFPFLETTYKYECDFDTFKIKTHTIIDNGTPPATPPPTPLPPDTLLGSIKSTASAMYNAIKAEFEKYHVILPPSAAIAGIITRVDNERGFWKAPANVSVANVVKPLVSVSRSEHDLLNINSNNGRSVNAILNMPGYGTVVMGARTLDGNDNEWKYINVRRFFSIVEESIKKSTNWVIFEPNNASTWTKVQAMIENYLFNKWRDGALQGAKPEQAYFVNVGLNKTMNSVDILEGRLIVEIGMAVARPAEFIILRFEHKLQVS
ncbi:MAG: phage tail sheath C-terminal domain-containing protein [Chitinophagales bacterium]